MHLSRIRVPEFRVLKDVDIQFEKEFTPQIFPLGSQNGGGKSTLLQLIFVLLHCSTEPSRIPYLKNMLKGFKANEEGERTLAIFDIVEGDRTIELEFFCCQDSYINELIHSDQFEQHLEKNQLESCNLEENLSQKQTPNNLGKIKKYKWISERSRETFEKILSELIDEKEKNWARHFGNDVTPLSSFKSTWFSQNMVNKLNREGLNIPLLDSYQPDDLIPQVRSRLEKLRDEIQSYGLQIDQIHAALNSKNIVEITHYSGDRQEESYQNFLLCRVESKIDSEEKKPLLKRLAEKIFLAAPLTQVFLFFPEEVRKLLFEHPNQIDSSSNYYSQTIEAKSQLPGFFTYDFLSIEVLIDSFKAARDKDFNEAIETEGKYGNNYKTHLTEVSHLLPNKNISPKPDLSGVTLFMKKNDEKVELYPEDLSHGELKRLSIYMWLKSRNIEDCLVLMDEIEIALHPDWQYQIVSDLTEWAPNNQYILATHSYELCQALTPAHVKELEPKLINQ